MVLRVILLVVFAAAIDIYIWQAVRVLIKPASLRRKKRITILYFSLSFLTLAGMLFYAFIYSMPEYRAAFRVLFVWAFMFYAAKLFVLPVLVVDDVRRFIKLTRHFFKPKKENDTGSLITRSQFLAKAGLVAGAVPLAAMTYGIVSGAHDYRVRRVKIYLPNLPKSFDGLRVAQISDIHAGSFYNKTAVQGGVDMLLAEKADIIFFTGDLVNSETKEINNWVSVFDKIKAPLGVYSVLGNHDYGDYRSWPSVAAKQKNMEDMVYAHRLMGWKLLRNENTIIGSGGDKIALVGTENWGSLSRFPKLGDIKKATENTDEAAVKLLLSHDPSHWRAKVLDMQSDIDVMFAGHTHGMQFGIEVGDFKWSPIQYRYPEWAGLYREENQCLYVNRGFGFLGFPGRVGILPEITVVELKRA